MYGRESLSDELSVKSRRRSAKAVERQTCVSNDRACVRSWAQPVPDVAVILYSFSNFRNKDWDLLRYCAFHVYIFAGWFQSLGRLGQSHDDIRIDRVPLAPHPRQGAGQVIQPRRLLKKPATSAHKILRFSLGLKTLTEKFGPRNSKTDINDDEIKRLTPSRHRQPRQTITMVRNAFARPLLEDAATDWRG
jgi:hypothetical protein